MRGPAGLFLPGTPKALLVFTKLERKAFSFLPGSVESQHHGIGEMLQVLIR